MDILSTAEREYANYETVSSCVKMGILSVSALETVEAVAGLMELTM